MRTIFIDEMTVSLNTVFRQSGWLTALRRPFAVAVTQKPFRPNFSAWATRAYKPLTVFMLALLVLLVCYVKAGLEVMSVTQTAVITGVGCIILSILLSPEWAGQSVVKTSEPSVFSVLQISPGQAFSHAGSLVIGLAGLMLVYANHHNQFVWSVYPTLSLIGGFALGGSSIMLLVSVVGGASMKDAENAKTAVHPRVIPERLDVLAGAVVAGILLGTTLVETNTFNLEDNGLSAGLVWVPVMLAWCGICTSLIMGRVLKTVDLPPTVKRILNLSALLIVAYILVVNMMPVYWVIEGKEKLSSEIFLAASLGSVGSFALLEAGYAYKWLRTRYYAWVLQRPSQEAWYLRPLRHLFRTICLSIPVVLVAWFLKGTFDHVGLYGIVIAAISLLANLNAPLSLKRQTAI